MPVLSRLRAWSSCLLLPLLAASLSGACKTAGSKEGSARPGRVPAWVMQGSGAFALASGPKVFRAVGAAMRHQTSDLQGFARQRAGLELDRVLRSWRIVILARDRELGAGPRPKRDVENVAPALRSIAAGAGIKAQWQDPGDGSFFVLLELELSEFKKGLASSQALDPGVLEELLEYADPAFAEMAQAVKQ
ncbi:MAG: hypothetical protein HY924_02975 [Elusimicrobia bacterium]|nr:hypothetical protein [Elusimicrobiota bacterium]